MQGLASDSGGRKARRSAVLEEGVWGRNLVKVSPPLVRPQPHPHPQPHLYPQRTLASSKIRTGSSNRRLPALTPGSEIRYYFLPQRAAAALRAISWRCSLVRVRPAAEVGAPGCPTRPKTQKLRFLMTDNIQCGVANALHNPIVGPVEAKPSKGFSPTPPLPTPQRGSLGKTAGNTRQTRAARG